MGLWNGHFSCHTLSLNNQYNIVVEPPTIIDATYVVVKLTLAFSYCETTCSTLKLTVVLSLTHFIQPYLLAHRWSGHSRGAQPVSLVEPLHQMTISGG